MKITTLSLLALLSSLSSSGCTKQNEAAPAAVNAGNVAAVVNSQGAQRSPVVVGGAKPQTMEFRITQLEGRLADMEAKKAAPKAIEGLKNYIAALKKFQSQQAAASATAGAVQQIQKPAAQAAAPSHAAEAALAPATANGSGSK